MKKSWLTSPPSKPFAPVHCLVAFQQPVPRLNIVALPDWPADLEAQMQENSGYCSSKVRLVPDCMPAPGPITIHVPSAPHLVYTRILNHQDYHTHRASVVL